MLVSTAIVPCSKIFIRLRILLDSLSVCPHFDGFSSGGSADAPPRQAVPPALPTPAVGRNRTERYGGMRRGVGGGGAGGRAKPPPLPYEIEWTIGGGGTSNNCMRRRAPTPQPAVQAATSVVFRLPPAIPRGFLMHTLPTHPRLPLPASALGECPLLTLFLFFYRSPTVDRVCCHRQPAAVAPVTKLLMRLGRPQPPPRGHHHLFQVRSRGGREREEPWAETY